MKTFKSDIFFIPFNTPSLKNSKQATSRGLFMSKTCRQYLQKLGVKSYGKHGVTDYKQRENMFKKVFRDFKVEKYRAKVSFHFVRDSKRKFDFHNAVQIVADLMVAHDIIEDDDMSHFLPFPWGIEDKWFSVDKENAGVYIKIEQGE